MALVRAMLVGILLIFWCSFANSSWAWLPKFLLLYTWTFSEQKLLVFIRYLILHILNHPKLSLKLVGDFWLRTHRNGFYNYAVVDDVKKYSPYAKNSSQSYFELGNRFHIDPEKPVHFPTGLFNLHYSATLCPETTRVVSDGQIILPFPSFCTVLLTYNDCSPGCILVDGKHFPKDAACLLI